jgi:elongation of very long chain fatty acids protein 4
MKDSSGLRGIRSWSTEIDGRKSVESEPPIEAVLLGSPSALARYTCLSITVGLFAVWGKYTFVDEANIPGAQVELHHWSVPLKLTVGYLASLPLLRLFSRRYVHKSVDIKLLLRESMILYNAAQVLLNLWMVCRILDALLFRGHPFMSGPVDLVDTGATYAVWVHYCDKYLEFFDTFFMVLRGRMDQVRAYRKSG